MTGEQNILIHSVFMGNEYFYITKETVSRMKGDMVWLLRDVPLNFPILVDVPQYFSLVSTS